MTTDSHTRAVIGLCRRWELTDHQAEILLDLPPGAGVDQLTEEGKTRVEHLLGILAALRALFRDPARAHAWVKRPNSIYDGRTALDVMLAGGLDAIIRVRRYLEAECA